MVSCPFHKLELYEIGAPPVLALLTVGDVYASLCKKKVTPEYGARDWTPIAARMRDRIFAAVATTPLRTAADLRNFGGLAVQIERLIEDAKKPTSDAAWREWAEVLERVATRRASDPAQKKSADPVLCQNSAFLKWTTNQQLRRPWNPLGIEGSSRRRAGFRPLGCGWRATGPPGVRTAGSNRLRGELRAVNFAPGSPLLDWTLSSTRANVR